METPLDPKALKILFDTYWTSSGWKKDRHIPPEDLDYAMRAGVMFHPLEVRHDDLILGISKLVRELDLKKVARAFLASLSTHRLDLRSALGSFAFASRLPGHAFESSENRCDVCGFYRDTDEREDLNVLNFERLKWGGVRHTSPLYVWFDLDQFSRLEIPRPSAEDEQILRGILAAAQGVPSDATVQALEKSLTKVLKSNKAEREILLDILGLCGILETRDHQGFLSRFTASRDRELPPWRFVEREYPVCWWRGKDGVNKRAVTLVFGGAANTT